MDLKFPLRWNNKFPLDYWWRKTYKVPFNSKQHRESNLLDVLFEFQETKIYKQAEKNVKDKFELEKAYQKEGWLKEKEVILDDKIFDDIANNLSSFDDD